jgi:hypothetical protein
VFEYKNFWEEIIAYTPLDTKGDVSDLRGTPMRWIQVP